MPMTTRVLSLRIFHGAVTLYFALCLAYMYYVAITGHVNDPLFVLAVCSLFAEGITVFLFNSGDCPLIHVQRKIGDNTPFFALWLPVRLAKLAIPIFAGLTLFAILLLLLRFVVG
jgi:hypothetical protein